MHWPQITYIVLTCMGIGIAMAEHGKPKTGHHNFVTTVVSSIICLTLLYCGGFFS